MKVIAGLGNPGAQYADTPHSVGFEVADAVVRAMGATWQSKAAFKCEMASGILSGVKVTVVKPMTFMNLSGEAVAPVVRYSNASAADLIVVSDDIDLPLGRLRIRFGGSAGGHNGLKSVIAHMATGDFTRVRIGVGRGASSRSEVIGHVLGKFDPDSRTIASIAVAEAAKAVEFLVSNGVENAMNRWNGFCAAGKETQKS